MRNRLTNYLVAILAGAMIMTSLPVNLLVVQAEETKDHVRIEETVSGADGGEEDNSEEDIFSTKEVEVTVYQTTGDGELSGTLGDNNGFSWSYEESTATLTVTGQDSGLNNLRSVLPDTVLESVKNIIFQDCIVSGSLQEMFLMQENIECVEFQNCDTSNVTNMNKMFYMCSNLSRVNVNEINTSNVTDMAYMFVDCISLSNVDVSSFDTSNVTDMRNMFAGCSKLTGLEVGNFNTSKVTNMRNMFAGCSKLTALNLSNFDTSNVTDMYAMFYNCSSLTDLDLSSFDTSDVTDMKDMFRDCKSLKSVGVSSFDTGKVTGIGWMFYNCSSLESLNLSNFNTGNVTSMWEMFSGCSNLKSVDVSSFDTSETTTMNGMFYNCSSLKSVDVSNFDTGKLTNMSGMFLGCKSLENVDLSNFDTSDVTAMGNLFLGCSSLKSADISSFDTSQVTYMGGVFLGCDRLETIKTPKNMIAGQSISLPDVFLNSEKKQLTEITSAYCNQTLSKQEQYAITYHLAGGKNNASNPASYAQSSATITLKAPARTGYTFGGWYSEIGYKNEVTEIKAGSTGDVNLYAKWKKNTYKITYKLGGGKNHKSNPTTYTVTSTAFTLKKPTRTGYTFAGWYSDSKYKTKVAKVSKGSTGNKTFYAKWTPNKYKIKLNGNGATSGKMNTLNNRKYGTSYKLPPNVYKKKGYRFVGWNTKKNGKGKTYKDMEIVKNLTSTNGKTITLYAQWKKK